MTYDGRRRRARPEECAEEGEIKDDDKTIYDTVVLFGNTGEWEHGAKARMVFKDGRVLDRVLPEDAQWVRLRIRYTSKLAWAAVDPDRSNTWDWNRLNDSIVLGRGKGAAETLGAAPPSGSTSGWVAAIGPLSAASLGARMRARGLSRLGSRHCTGAAGLSPDRVTWSWRLSPRRRSRRPWTTRSGTRSPGTI